MKYLAAIVSGVLMLWGLCVVFGDTPHPRNDQSVRMVSGIIMAVAGGVGLVMAMLEKDGR